MPSLNIVAGGNKHGEVDVCKAWIESYRAAGGGLSSLGAPVNGILYFCVSMTSPCPLNRQKRRQNTISHCGGRSPNAPWLHPWRSKFTTCKISINLASVGYLFQTTVESLVNHLVGKLFTVSRFLLHHHVHVDVHIFKLIRLFVHSLW